MRLQKINFRIIVCKPSEQLFLIFWLSRTGPSKAFDQFCSENMKDLKKKYGEESREDKKNRHKKLFLPSVISLAVCIAMVIVGKF